MTNNYSDLKILIVEDDEDDYFILSELLLDALGTSPQIDWAEDYQSAQELIGAGQYQFYFLDNRLGAHLGLELIDVINSQYQTSPPIIMLSGVDDHETDLQAMEKGADDYLVKSQLSAPLLERTIRYSLKSKLLEEKLAKMAHFDSLTGLYNRSIFRELLLKTIAHSNRSQQKFALVTIDVDKFKYINDQYGHPAGDQLLIEVARRLKHSIRSADIIARLGGDEFSLLLKDVGNSTEIVKLVETIMGAFTAVVELGSKEVAVTISSGIAIYPTDASSEMELIARSDRALYQAKSMGRYAYSFYNKELHMQARKQHDIELQLAQAIKEHKLLLYYQPIYSLTDNKLSSYEALLRWPNETGGFYNTEEIIAIAEQGPLILTLGDWVFNRACQQILHWQQRGEYRGKISINVSAKQFENDDFTRKVLKKLLESPLLSGKFTFEITERDPLQSTAIVINRLQQLVDCGCEFSVDDFGVGHASIAYLRTFPIAAIKIDKSIVQNILSREKDLVLCKAIIAIAKALSLSVVAEGVESLEIANTLSSIGCPLVQGYYFARPMPVDEVSSSQQYCDRPLAISVI